MGQKTNPTGFRLAVRRNWQSRWFASKKDFPKLLLEDQIIRQKLMEKLKQALRAAHFHRARFQPSSC
jgi:small subunit ribosomal protein S3